MDLDYYANQYTNLSREEIQKMRDTWCGGIESGFERLVEYRHTRKKQIKKNGRLSIQTQPLVQMLSVDVQLRNENLDKPLSIYGRIQAEFNESDAVIVHELYDRDRSMPEILSTSRSLTLSGPGYSCYPVNDVKPLSKVRVMLFDEDDNVFAEDHFSLVDTETEEYDYEKFKCKVIHCDQASLTLRYVVIPFGARGRVQVKLFNKQAYKVHDFINVNGKISIRYADAYGDHVGEEECVLFEKGGDEFERIEFPPGSLSLQLSRCHVALPPYSSIVVDVDLSEFGTMRKVANKCIELLPPQTHWSDESFVQNDIITRVEVEWSSPRPFGRCSSSSSRKEINTEEMDIKGGNPTEEIEEMDTEGEDKSSDDESDDSSSNHKLPVPWSLRPHKGWLSPSPAVEIFSVFVGREKSKAVQTYGSIEVVAGDVKVCSLFKRDEKDALALAEDMKLIPIPDGSRLVDDSLGMKVDIKGCLAIKGYVDWNAEVVDSELWNEKQICSLIRGHNGFAAVHYSIFSYAVGASIKVYCQLKAGCGAKVYGSLVAQYNCYDYSTRYNRDYYRIVLLKRSRDDSVQPSIDGTIPLSRSMVVVPSYSSLIVNMDLSFGKILSCAGGAEIEICERSKIIETTYCSLRIEVDWCEVK